MLNCFKANDSFYDRKPFLSFIVEHLFVEPFAGAIDYFENTAEFNNPNALASKTLPLHCRLKNSALIQILSIITLFLCQTKEQHLEIKHLHEFGVF